MLKIEPINIEVVEDTAQKLKNDAIPDEVIEIFNEQILKNWSHFAKSATVSQDIVEKLISEKLGITLPIIHERHLLDVEDIYRKAGYHVIYNGPTYNENFSAYFKFSKNVVNFE